MTTACCTPLITTSQHRTTLRAWDRWALRLQRLWRAHQERVHLNDESRSLQELDDRTLRDLGLAERVLTRHDTLDAAELARNRWS